MVGLHFFCSEVFLLPLVSFSSFDHLGPLFPYHLPKKMCLLCPHIAYIQGQKSDLHIGLILSQSWGRAWGLGKELLNIIEKKYKGKVFESFCLFRSWKVGFIRIDFGSQARTEPAENRGLLSSHATTTLSTQRSGSRASVASEVWEHPVFRKSLWGQILCQCGALKLRLHN